jgi:hypothetical protein
MERIEKIQANGNGNGKPQHLGRPSPIDESWSYGGIDTARDHKQLGGAIGRLELGILEVHSAARDPDCASQQSARGSDCPSHGSG